MKRALASLLVLGSVFFGSVASADVPPPDICGKAGEACKNAGETYNQPGFCTPTKCRRLVPGESGLKPYEWDCNKCFLSPDAGAVLAAAEAAAAPKKSGCGCKLVGRVNGGAGEALGIGVALGALVMRRRKKSG
jgi:hypothetical protein